MFNKMIAKVNNVAGNMKLSTKKNSPTLFIILGIGGVITASVMACRATTKLPDIMDDFEDKLEDIHEREAENEETNDENVAKEIKHDTAMVYLQTVVSVVKLYTPSVALGVLSLASIVKSHNILKDRNAALTAAYIAADKGFKDYRKRVVERFGEEVDKQLRMGVHEEDFEETTVGENGKEKKVKKKINVADPSVESDYVKFFTRSNPYWLNDPDQMTFFFRSQQNYLNDMLHTKGFVTLNEAYTALGFKETKAGMVCGWLNNHDDGDGYIELKVVETCIPNENGDYERVYAIDFNVDGCIYDKM